MSELNNETKNLDNNIKNNNDKFDLTLKFLDNEKTEDTKFELNLKFLNDEKNIDTENVESNEKTTTNETEKPLVDEGEQYDEDGKLKPNIRYRTDDGEGRIYIYETDDKGRIIKVTAENLQLKERNGRLPNDSDTPDKKETDEAGHLIADRFGGSPKLDNLLSQDAKLNNGEWKKMENEWAEAINDGKDVSVDIEPVYDSDSKRPSSYKVTYTIDGEVYVKEFKNGEA